MHKIMSSVSMLKLMMIHKCHWHHLLHRADAGISRGEGFTISAYLPADDIGNDIKLSAVEFHELLRHSHYVSYSWPRQKSEEGRSFEGRLSESRKNSILAP